MNKHVYIIMKITFILLIIYEFVQHPCRMCFPIQQLYKMYGRFHIVHICLPTMSGLLAPCALLVLHAPYWYSKSRV